MNYLNDELKNSLASQYVLGTLQGPARNRFQRLVIEQQSIRQSLWLWEKHLNQLGNSLPEQQPDAKVWRAIQAQLGFNNTDKTVKPVAWWRSFSAVSMAMAASILLAAILLWPQFKTPEPLVEQVAVVQSAKAEALWLIQIGKWSLQIQATDKIRQYIDKDYELWMLAKDGRPPISLGLLPKRGQLNLPRSALFDQVDIAALAVSLEPLGGSPNGQPTTVLYTTELVSL